MKSHDEQRKLLDERLTHKTRVEPQVDENLVERPNSAKDSVNKLRMYADDLHSASGYNNYASAMSLAADEIVKLREYAALLGEYAALLEADLIATIEQRDALQLRIEEQQRCYVTK